MVATISWRRWSWPLHSVLLLLFRLISCGESGMNDEETAMLMNFKSSVLDPNHALITWTATSSSCSWKGITCTQRTGRVAQIDLPNEGLTGCLNLTHLLTLSQLHHLDLHGNSFYTTIGPLLHSNPHASLKTLDLSFNNFTVGLQELIFPSLYSLNLSHNRISGALHQNIKNCVFMQDLDLSFNDLEGNIDGSIFTHMKQLRNLSLSHNRFSGEIPSGMTSTCATLQSLDLSSNKLHGQLPYSFSSCSVLQTFHLGDNIISGDFPNGIISNLTSLRRLSAPFNNMTGVITLTLARTVHLQALDLSSNRITGIIPSGFCSFSSLHEKLPASMEEILLANNFISGEGTLSELCCCRKLKTIDLSLNDLTGSIPEEIWSLPDLTDLVLWGNSITGVIPDNVCINRKLETIILDSNLLRGTLPLSISNCTRLRWLSFSNNQIEGEIPNGIGLLSNLTTLKLGNNVLSGEIPADLGGCPRLIWLELQNNSLTGLIPRNLSSRAGYNPDLIRGMEFAYISAPSCRGVEGVFEFKGIREQSLMHLPMIRGCPSVNIYAQQQIFQEEEVNCSVLYIDLSSNELSGSIPESFGSLRCLHVLSLQHNKLTGGVPETIGNLSALEDINLSHNHLEGPVPLTFQNLHFLMQFDVSNNNLSGPIPSGGQLTTFPAIAYTNNSGLCGVPLSDCLTIPHDTTQKNCSHQRNRRRRRRASDILEEYISWRSAVTGYGCGILLGIVGKTYLFQKTK